MLYYPKIPSSSAAPLSQCIAFEKYDGTNLHWDWDRDFGWHAFGTRRDSFNLTGDGVAEFVEAHAHLSECVEVFHSLLAETVERVFRENPRYGETQDFRVFTEFFGPNSFAGLHQAGDPKELRLFDVQAGAEEILGPEQFVADFGHTHSARVIYRGKLTGAFAERVRTGYYNVAEGVVCKGGRGGKDLWMAKIKTNAYLQRLKQAFESNWEQYWE